MTRIEKIITKVKSQIGIDTPDTFYSHCKIFLTRNTHLHGTTTETGFKIWKYDSFARGIMHPVVIASLREVDGKVHIDLRSKMNIAGLIISIILLSAWGIGGALLIKGDDSLATFLKYRIPIWILYFSVLFILITYTYSVSHKLIRAKVEEIIKEALDSKD